jgi:chromate reductase, NAD(P)H dehydrogenase (quinone)
MAIRIVAICGSVRPGNYTAKALKLALDELGNLPDVDVAAFRIEDLDLSLPGLPAGNPAALERFQKAVGEATGVLLASPEYHGGVSSPMKLAIDNLGFPSALAGKPIALLGVAAGGIGAIKSLEQLRLICSHVGAIVLPSPISVANCQKVFDEDGNCLDPKMEKMIRGCGRGLIDYIKGAICPRVTLEAMARQVESVAAAAGPDGA